MAEPLSKPEQSASPERRVVCEACGEVVETEPIGGPLDLNPELGDADHLLDPDECPICNPEL